MGHKISLCFLAGQQDKQRGRTRSRVAWSGLRRCFVEHEQLWKCSSTSKIWCILMLSLSLVVFSSSTCSWAVIHRRHGYDVLPLKIVLLFHHYSQIAVYTSEVHSILSVDTMFLYLSTFRLQDVNFQSERG